MRIILAFAILLLSSTFTWSGSMTKPRQLGVAAELPGSALKWIHIAEVEFAREKLDLDKYRISVEEEGDSVFVILTGLKQPKNAVGSVGPDPGYEVEISKKDRKVLRSNYVR
jgi:hypothetical protein